MKEYCLTYWGSHGCDLELNHLEPCKCDCCECENHLTDCYDYGCVGKAPYYGFDTHFYTTDDQPVPQQTLDAAKILVIFEEGKSENTVHFQRSQQEQETTQVSMPT